MAKSDYLRNQERPSVFGYELNRATLTPVRTPIDTRRKGDYGADPLGGGKFKMVPSGDIVDYAERCKRLAKDSLPEPIPVDDAFQVTAVGMRKVAEAMRRTFKLQAHNSAVEAENLRREGNSERAKKFLAQEAKWLAMAARSDEAIYREYKGGQATDAQVDTDAAELANAYKTQGEAAARRLWAEKIKGLNYGQQVILQDKMAKLIKGKATDAANEEYQDLLRKLGELDKVKPRPLAKLYGSAGPTPQQKAAWEDRTRAWNRETSAIRRKLPALLDKSNAEFRARQTGKATDAARLHRALDAAMDARAKDELVMWGIPKGETERYKEVLLLSNGTPEKVARVKELATRDGFHSFRTANVNLGKPPSFGRNVLGKDARAKGRDASADVVGIWSYGYPHWRWKKENDCLPENVDAMLAYWRRDNPTMAYRASKKMPVGRPTDGESLKPLRTFHI